MNKRMIVNTLGKILIVEGFMLILPLITSLVYKEGIYLSYMIPIAILLLFGYLVIKFVKPKRNSIGSKDGLIIVGLSWIVMSIFGTLPYMISGSIPSFVNALFETVSGFTTTGASVLYPSEFSNIPNSIMLYRSLTHFIGGMGVLVFVLAILPNSEGKNIYILKAESTGPQVGKLVSKLKLTARILYLMYVIFTLIEIILLVISPSMNLFEAIIYSFSTAGTGGFSLYSDSCASFSPYCQIVIAIFMMLFGINFNIFYFIIIGKISKALKSEELITYLGIMIGSSIIIAFNLFFIMKDSYQVFSLAFRDSFFQVSSFMTSTGFSNTDFSDWPMFTKTLLIVLMYVGACAGSTGGGLKVSRFLIVIKSSIASIKRMIHPRSIQSIRLEGSIIDEETEKNVLGFYTLMFMFTLISTIIISIDGFDFETNFSVVSSCINNIGAAFGEVAKQGTFGIFSARSKVLLIILMLIGRLELYPIIILFMPKIWTNK